MQCLVDLNNRGFWYGKCTKCGCESGVSLGPEIPIDFEYIACPNCGANWPIIIWKYQDAE